MAVMSMGGYGPCDAWGGNFALYAVRSKSLLYSDYFCPEWALFHFTFTDDGKVVFVGIPPYPAALGYRGYRVSFVDSTTGVLHRQLTFEGEVYSVSPDGSKIATAALQSPGGTEISDTYTQKVIGRV